MPKKIPKHSLKNEQKHLLKQMKIIEFKNNNYYYKYKCGNGCQNN